MTSLIAGIAHIIHALNWSHVHACNYNYSMPNTQSFHYFRWFNMANMDYAQEKDKYVSQTLHTLINR